MSNAFIVLSNSDLFYYMQALVKGNEKMVLDFCKKFHSNLSLQRLIEEALSEKNIKIADKIYQNQRRLVSFLYPSSAWRLDWQLHQYSLRPHSKYPHKAYSLLSTCEWLHTRMGDEFNRWKRYMDTAAASGDLELVKFMHDHRHNGCTIGAMNNAAATGCIDVIKFLHHNRTEGCSTDAIDWAAREGHLEVVKFLHMSRTEGCTTYAINWAATNGQLEVVKFLRTNRTEGYTKQAIIGALRNNHVEISEYLQDLHTPIFQTEITGNRL